ncbi:MAG: M20/M25/M40 family metallo-hydrolase [Longimicrobiales bacterium]|nr:M20/M25/M40 family metallo-hydrolase [Longimicrobiales bacterium]
MMAGQKWFLFTGAFLLLQGGATAHAQESNPPLVTFQTEIVKRLTGGAEIAPGVTLQNRGAAENRVAVRSYLSSVLGSLGLEPLRQPYRENGENVYALLPSTTGSDEYVVIGAHFDTVERSPGASDNATGCAVVLAVARELGALPVRERNVFLVLFDEEERGLLGSRAFAEWLVDEGKEVVAVHTIDQMGWDGDGDGAFELEIPYDGALDLYRQVAEASGFVGTIHVTQESGSDHSAFRRLGMPAVGLTEEYRNGDTTPHIHRPTDSWETVDFENLGSVTRLVQAAVTVLVEVTGSG